MLLGCLRTTWPVRLTAASMWVLLAGCGPGGDSQNQPKPDAPAKDEHVVENRHDYEEDPRFISPPILGRPIYACSSNVTITGFLKGATLNVFINGAPAPNPSVVGQIPEVGVNF